MSLHTIPGRTKKLPPLRVGVGGPVGSGKTTLVEMLCKTLRERYDLVVVTNDIYTKEDQRLLTVAGALEPERIMGVETGGCPHTAIRDDTSMNLAAINELEKRHPDVELILVESGGDNLSATFSPELVDSFIYVIDVAEGDKIPRKGGPAIRHSDLLLINKIELAPYVGADLDVMARDAKLMRVPPELRTSDGQGREQRLKSHGLIEVRFFDGDAEQLEIAATADVEVPLPENTPLKDGDRVDLYHYDTDSRRFEREGEALFVVDMDSRNGTAVDGTRISERRKLENGEHITEITGILQHSDMSIMFFRFLNHFPMVFECYTQYHFSSYILNTCLQTIYYHWGMPFPWGSNKYGINIFLFQ